MTRGIVGRNNRLLDGFKDPGCRSTGYGIRQASHSLPPSTTDQGGTASDLRLNWGSPIYLLCNLGSLGPL